VTCCHLYFSTGERLQGERLKDGALLARAVSSADKNEVGDEDD